MKNFIKGIISSAIAFVVALSSLFGISIGDLKNISDFRVYTPDQITAIERESYERGYDKGYKAGENDSSQDYYISNDNSFQYDIPAPNYTEPTVYYTPNGECYHVDYECRYIVGHERHSTTLSKAKQKQLRPCSGCAYGTDWD